MMRASNHVVRHTARLLHSVMVVAMGLLLAASLLLAAVAYRLSIGPVNASLVSALHGDTFVINGTVGLSFEGIALAWEGFHGGVGAPLDFRLSNITVVDPEGHRLLTARQALLSLSLAALLRGQLVPRSLELDDGLVTVTRQRGRSFNFDAATGDATGPPAERPGQPDALRSIVGGLIHPAGGARGSPDLLMRVRLRNFGLVVRDEQLGLTWRASGSELDIRRQPSGSVVGAAHVLFALGDQQAAVTLGVDLSGAASGRVEAAADAIQPAMIKQLATAFPALAAVDVPVSLRAAMELGTDLVPLAGHATIKVGAGSLNLGTGSVPVREGTLVLSAAPDRLVIEDARLSLAFARAAAPAAVTMVGTVRHQADRLAATVKATLDHLEVADLGSLWPQALAPGARPWVVQNVTAGTIRHATASLVVEAAIDLHDVSLTKAGADLDADGVSINWLDHVPPVERAQVHLHLADPDRLVITASSGHQRASRGGGDLLLQDGQMDITGLSQRDQDARIRLRIEAPVANAVALLKEPRLHLLDRQGIDLKDASGAASVMMGLQFPLVNSLQAEQIQFKSTARLSGVRVGKVVLGRDLRDGELTLTADNDGLGVKGPAVFASIPVALNGAVDFNAGPPSQVVERLTVTGRPDAGQLAAAGFNLGDFLASGNVPLTVVVQERRDGEGSVALNADLAAASLSFKPLGRVQPAGAASQATALLLMSHDRLAAIPRVTVEGAAVSLSASAECADGTVRAVSIDRARFGKSDIRGTVTLPANGPVGVVLSGPEIDLSSKLGETASPSGGAPSGGATGEASDTAPDWSLSARFEQALLAGGERADALSVRARSEGGVLRLLDLTGSLSPGAAFSAQVGAAPGGRRLTVSSADAGAFLRAAGLTAAVRKGRLSIEGAFDDAQAGHPLTGTGRIEDARIVGAPALAKLLQAMTLYGLTDVLRGPGIGVSQVVVPYRYERNRLQLNDARMFSASLGLTAKGTVDLATNQVAISGTIVPAYVFNSVLGHIPFVGKLFSPEAGGGLFAARYRVDGPIDNVATSVNPLSVLTPGALRNLFDIGGGSRQ